MSIEVWSTCDGCQEEITQIEAVRFGGKCQSCYLGIGKQTAKRSITYFTLLSAILTERKRRTVVEANIAFPGIGVVEVIIGVGSKGIETIDVPTIPWASGSATSIKETLDDIVSSCIDFEEVVETLRTNSVG